MVRTGPGDTEGATPEDDAGRVTSVVGEGLADEGNGSVVRAAVLAASGAGV